MPGDVASARLCCRPASAAQMAAGEHVFEAIRRWCRSDDSDPSDGGLSQLADFLCQRVHGSDIFSGLDAYAMAGAEPEKHDEYAERERQAIPPSTLELEKGKVALPTVAGHIVLEPPALPLTLANVIKEEGAFVRPEPPEKLAPSFTSVTNWHELAVEFLHRGLCCLLPESEGVVHRGRRVSAGLFGVPKKQTDCARLIIDRRPQNCLEVSLRKVVLDRVLRGDIASEHGLHLIELMTLPFFGQFGRLMMSESSVIQLTMEDAENYYYHMLLPRSLQRTNAVGPMVPTDVLPPHLPALLSAQSEFGCLERWSLHMTAPPMGDVKSPDIAQAVHTHVALTSGGVRRSSWMRHGHQAPTDAVWAGTYVDDFGQVAMLDPRLPAPLDDESVRRRAKTEHT
eukprot:1259933-Amphidinium_carterae.1